MPEFDLTGLEAYKSDRDAEKEGIWFVYPNGIKFLMARAGGSNNRYKRMLSKALRPHRRVIDQGRMDPDLSDELLRRVYANTVLLDWEGIKDEKGKSIPYTPQAGEEFFAAIPELFSELIDRATEAQNFVDAEVEEAKEELGKPSDGK
jgi:hypothetical protein